MAVKANLTFLEIFFLYNTICFLLKKVVRFRDFSENSCVLKFRQIVNKQKISRKNSGKTMENENGRFWQSPDMTVTKTVIKEGDIESNLESFGITIILQLFEHNFADYEETKTKVFDPFDNSGEENITIHPGRGTNEIDKALEQAAVSMFLGEKSRFDVSAEMNGRWITLHFVAERISDMIGSFSTEWSPDSKLKFAEQHYYKPGVELIRNRKYHEAFKLFKTSAALCLFGEIEEKNKGKNEQLLKSLRDLKLRSLLNLTLCQKNIENHTKVVDGIDYILDNNSEVNNEAKLLARRGQAHVKLQNYEKRHSKVKNFRYSNQIR